jgi:hypothetical protein
MEYPHPGRRSWNTLTMAARNHLLQDMEGRMDLQTTKHHKRKKSPVQAKKRDDIRPTVDCFSRRKLNVPDKFICFKKKAGHKLLRNIC